MHHRSSKVDRNKPTLRGGAAIALPPPAAAEETAIDRRLNELREMTFRVQPVRRLLDTGPPSTPLCVAA
jgi:hypothetical protein